MELKAVLFDLDGVLADSEPMWNEIDAAMLANYGVDYKGEHKHQVLGKGFQLALAFYRDAFNIRAEIEEMAMHRMAVATDYYANHIPIYPSTHAVLRQLKERGLKIGLATSSVGAFIHPFLKRHDLNQYFDGLVTGEEVERGKPNPDIYLLAAQKVGIAPEYCLVVEDALAGVQAGKSAGMTVAAIPDPRFMDVTLYPGKADYIIDSLADLPGLIFRILAI